ncbi:aldehyde dehydrogenase family protein [Methylobacterium trifolii]|uniref:Succinate-semialdehyde dehydrogenase (Acetylating) n=1 Tax=Methylobacterium trifolii TaxID=1003092 RepID=A0ABQ4TVM3_9HYPH|nr:aldehyde dehydrogenase family protein [Methylobacterium trifolii]GJE58043.1 Succinate-semialdehyde dehydrogenase (acetylating) [Methylobacterium trifolii]
MPSPTLEAAIGGEVAETTTTSPDQVHRLVARAREAQAVFETFPQERVDAIVRDFGKYVYDNAEALAGMAHKETGLGVYEDKVLKAKGKARVIWNNLKGKVSRGIIGEDAEANLVLVAKPMGVVGAVCPVTNPIVTPMCNAMFALKAGNAIIFAPHPKADDSTWHLTKEYQRIVREHGGPDHLVQAVRHGSVETTQTLMKAVDVVVATGGGAMVKSAYSSGKPSFGVGAGNVPVVIDRGVDLKDAAEKIVAGASFDNGIICSHEQFVLTPEEQYADTLEAFRATGKVWFTDDPAEIDRIRAVVFHHGHLNKDVVGRSAQEIGAKAGLAVPDTARIILVPAIGAGTDDILAKEKLCPVVAILPYKTFEEAVEKAKANLLVEGAGHSAALHSHDEAHIRAMGLALPISRLVVNQSSALTAGGSLTNGFAPTTTLGCGSWGGNSISENLDYKHLMNVSRIGKVIAHRAVPTDAEIWAA